MVVQSSFEPNHRIIQLFFILEEGEHMTFSDEFPGDAEQRIWRSALGLNPLAPSIKNKQLYDRLDSILLSYLQEHEMLWQCFTIAEPLCTTEQKEHLQLNFADTQQNLQHALNHRRADIAIAGDHDRALVTLEMLYQVGEKLLKVRQVLEQFLIPPDPH